MLFCCFEAFTGNFTVLFSPKRWLSQRRAQKNSESLFFLTSLKRGQILRKIWICLNQLILIKPLKGEQILTKTCFSPVKVNHILLNYAFLLFWSIFWWNSQRTSLYIKKSDYLRKEPLKYSEILFFLTNLKGGKSWGKFGFV